MVSSKSGGAQKAALREVYFRSAASVLIPAFLLVEVPLGQERGRSERRTERMKLTELRIPIPTGLMVETMWERFVTVMRDVYGHLIRISTIIAVTMAAVALIIRMVSRNQRAVDEATAWLKRIVVTWVILNSLGFVVAYLQPLIAGGNYTG